MSSIISHSCIATHYPNASGSFFILMLYKSIYLLTYLHLAMCNIRYFSYTKKIEPDVKLVCDFTGKLRFNDMMQCIIWYARIMLWQLGV